MSKYISLMPFVLLVLIAAGSGAVFQTGPWYEALNKPVWTPPNWVFPIAWTVLYIMIAIAGWLAWKADGIGPALVVWAVGLLLNALWSYIMFGRNDITLALFDVSAMWFLTAAFVWLTWNSAPTAAYLFIPYLAWVTFAAALNFEVWRLN